MKIRKAVKGDAIEFARMTKDLIDSGAGGTGGADYYIVDPITAEEIFINGIDNPDSVILVAEDKDNVVGVIGGMVITRQWNKHLKGMVLMGWNTKPGYGGMLTIKLLDEYLRIVENMGVTFFHPVSFSSIKPTLCCRHAFFKLLFTS